MNEQMGTNTVGAGNSITLSYERIRMSIDNLESLINHLEDVISFVTHGDSSPSRTKVRCKGAFYALYKFIAAKRFRYY